MHAAHSQWLDEHDALAVVLHSLSQLAQRLAQEPDEVDFCASRAMLVYLGDYPERVHHAHEDAELFARLRGRDPVLDATLERLRGQHAISPVTVMRLEHQLNRAEFAGPSARRKYAEDIERFVTAYLSHMQTEEREILPAAERLLSDADWDEIAALLAGERDPLHGVSSDAAYEELLGLIARIAPSPPEMDAR